MEIGVSPGVGVESWKREVGSPGVELEVLLENRVLLGAVGKKEIMVGDPLKLFGLRKTYG